MPRFVRPVLVLAALAAAAPVAANAAAVDPTFQSVCSACHSVTAGQAGTAAPNLRGVVGRKAASTSFAYSAALKKSNLTWTKASLDTFLTNPMKMVPGTRMFMSVPDKAKRTALINWLATQK